MRIWIIGFGGFFGFSDFMVLGFRLKLVSKVPSIWSGDPCDGILDFKRKRRSAMGLVNTTDLGRISSPASPSCSTVTVCASVLLGFVFIVKPYEELWTVSTFGGSSGDRN